jgi:pimeloyl-ACP methyl ester carboxylesterase
MAETLPPVALVHGWGGSYQGTYGATGWGEALARAGRKVIEIDLPGHGQKPASHDPAAYADMASGLDAMLPSGALDAVGFSLGAKVVLELASRAPSRFRRIVIGGLGNNIFDKELGGTIAAALDAGLPDEFRARMPLIAKYIDESANDYRAIAAVNRRPHNPQAEASRLLAIQSDILIVNGEKDTVAQPDDRLRAALPRAHYISPPGMDHFTMHRRNEFRLPAIAFLNA